MTGNERCCLSYWYPKLVAANIPAPKTIIIKTDLNLTPLCDGEMPKGIEPLLGTLLKAVRELGGKTNPVFFRTGHTSHKHDWRHSCYLPPGITKAQLLSRMSNLVEHSSTVDVIGLPISVWCVREMLPTTPVVILPAYGDMPLVRELRYFVEEGQIECSHSYWPMRAIMQGLVGPTFRDDPQAQMRALPEAFKAATQKMLFKEADYFEPDALAEQVAQAFANEGAAWSVDILETTRGWHVIDMALANRSWHWPTCPHSRKLYPVTKK